MLLAVSLHARSQEGYGYFNSLAVGVDVSTNGIGFDVATPIGNHLALRAGMNFMPGITFNTDADVDVAAQGYSGSTSIDLEGGLKRTQGEILLNVYPFKSLGLFVCGGAAFGGGTLVSIDGHSDELAGLAAEGEAAGVEIGDYTIPVDENGNVKGGLRVNNFRPYLGLGFGRAVPQKRLGFMVELGVQFHGTPEVYTDYGSLQDLTAEADNTFTDIINKITVYPVLKFRLSGKIF